MTKQQWINWSILTCLEINLNLDRQVYLEAN